jgi:hypothetical protein
MKDQKWIFFNGAWILSQNRPIETKEKGKRGRPPKEGKPKEPIHQCCGTCRFVEWNGVNEIKREWGTCRQFKESKRLSVHTTAEPCPLWKPRNANKVARETAKAEAVLEEFSKAKPRRRKT